MYWKLFHKHPKLLFLALTPQFRAYVKPQIGVLLKKKIFSSSLLSEECFPLWILEYKKRNNEFIKGRLIEIWVKAEECKTVMWQNIFSQIWNNFVHHTISPFNRNCIRKDNDSSQDWGLSNSCIIWYGSIHLRLQV